MRVHMIGNAHIDPVWLWPWQAGADEALATLASAADRCDEYPEFVFTRGEAWVYRQVERLRPELFARIRRLVERGQWHITGGQFIQPDLNLPTAAGLHRQIVHGQRYFRDRFGVAPTVGYNVDSFGHTASLPDILAAHGYTAYVFRRPEQHQVALPANTFVWQGVGGAEVVAFRITPGYVANFADLTGQVKIAVESADPALGHTMCFYGVGNHGGGPSKAMIEWIIANRSFDGHELVFSTPQAFFEAIADRRDLLPRVTVELQHTFPGCYSVMHDIKQAQRHGEQLLVQAEAAARALAADAAERDDSLARLDRAWDDLLFTEFHDILTGTSIPAAWESVRAMQGRARITGEEVLFDTTRRWSYRTLPRVERAPDRRAQHRRPAAARLRRGRALSRLRRLGRPLDQRRGRQSRAVPGGAAGSEPADPAHPVRGGDRRRRPAASSRCGPVRRRRPLPVDARWPASPDALSNGIVTVSLRDGGIGQIAFDGSELLGPARHRPASPQGHHRHLDLPHRPVGGAGGGDARGRGVAGRGDRAAAGPRAARRAPAQLAHPPDRQPLPRRGRGARRARGEFRRTPHAAPDAGRAGGASVAMDRRDRRRPRRPRAFAGGMAVPRLVAAARRRGRSRPRHQRLLQPQRERGDVAADAAQEPADGLGRRRPAHLFRPRPPHRPGLPSVRVRPSFRRTPVRGRPGRRASTGPPSRSSSSTATRAWTGRHGGRSRRGACGGRRCCATSPRAASIDPGQGDPGGLFKRPGHDDYAG